MYFKNKKRRPKSKRNIRRRKNSIASIKSLKRFIPSMIILLSFLILSFTILFLIKEINPLIKNQKLKYLCTYGLGNKKDDNYKKAKLKLDKMVGNGEKFCKNFIFPKDNKRSRFNIFSLFKDVLFKVVF